MSLSGRWRDTLTSACLICYTIIPATTVLPFNFNNLKTECQYNLLTFRNCSIIMFNTSEKNIQFISCNSYGIFINIPFTKSIFIINSIHIEVLIHFTARMNSDRMILSINVKHVTALMVILVWRYNYPYSIILMLIAYYYYMYLFLLFVPDTQFKHLGCSTLVSVTIYVVCSVLFDITYARLFTWTVYITLNYFKIMRQRFSIAFYQCDHKLFIQNLPPTE